VRFWRWPQRRYDAPAVRLGFYVLSGWWLLDMAAERRGSTAKLHILPQNSYVLCGRWLTAIRRMASAMLDWITSILPRDDRHAIGNI